MDTNKINIRQFKLLNGEEIIAAVGGSWIASRENINSNDWKQIKANAESAILNSQRTSQ